MTGSRLLRIAAAFHVLAYAAMAVLLQARTAETFIIAMPISLAATVGGVVAWLLCVAREAREKQIL